MILDMFILQKVCFLMTPKSAFFDFYRFNSICTGLYSCKKWFFCILWDLEIILQEFCKNLFSRFIEDPTKSKKHIFLEECISIARYSGKTISTLTNLHVHKILHLCIRSSIIFMYIQIYVNTDFTNSRFHLFV